MRNTKLLIFICLYIGILAIIFSAQIYLFYFKLVPATLAPFKGFPDIEKPVGYALDKTVVMMTFWFLLSIAHIVGYIIGIFLVNKTKGDDEGSKGRE
jgi:hypothetical protein